MNDLGQKRRAIRHLLSPNDPGDALASYYALWHDPRRTRITLHHDSGGRVNGFCTVSQTGTDLFRPLVTLRAEEPSAVGALLREALSPNRLYQVIVPVGGAVAGLASAVREQIDVSRSSLVQVYLLDPASFEPIINVLVQQASGPDDAPRFQIKSQEQVMAMAGTNWRSPDFAEVFVYVNPGARGRGWGRSVVSACTAALLAEHVRPLYTVDEKNEASQHIAQALGYTDTGLRDFVGEGQLARF